MKNREIEGLRGVLALSVVVSHYLVWAHADGLQSWSPAEASPIVRNLGKGAVAIFFMITGFLYYDVAAAGWRATDWRALAAGRMRRIYPLAIASIFATALTAWILSDQNLNARSLAGAALDLMRWATFAGEPDLFGVVRSHALNAGVLWSLGHEVAFYAVALPLAAVGGSFRPRRWPQWTVAASVIVAGLALRAAPAGPHAAGSSLVAFGSGMLIKALLHRPRVTAALRQPITAGLALALVAFAIVALPSPGLISLPFYAAVFACCASGCGYGFLNAAAMQILGRLSYGIYLWHGLVLYLMSTTIALSGVAPLLAAVAISVAISAFTYRLIERPALGRTPLRRQPSRACVAPEPRPA